MGRTDSASPPRAREEVDVRHPVVAHPLRDGEEDFRRRRVAQVNELVIAHDADDGELLSPRLPPRIPQVLTERRLPAEVGARERLVDDDRAGRVGAILIREVAPGEQLYAERLEKAGADRRHVNVRRGVVTRGRVAFDA